MIIIHNSKYLDVLSKLGIGGAHPGGINLTKELFKKERIHKTSRILDVGCGTGQTAAYLSHKYEANVTGLDLNPIMVAKAKERMKKNGLPVKIIQGTIEKIALPDHHFDCIISESVLAFVNKPRALNEIFRLLKRDGRFLAIEPTMNQRLQAAAEDEIKQFYGFDSLPLKNDWVLLLKQAGFEQIRVQKGTSIDSEPDFYYSDDIDPAFYEVMQKHFDILFNYQENLSYRVYTCTKKH